MKTLPVLLIFQTSIPTFHIQSNVDFMEVISESVYTLAETVAAKLREESLKTFGGSPGVILSSEFRTDRLPDESSLLTFSTVSRKSSSLSFANGFHLLSSEEALGQMLMRHLPEHFISKTVPLLSSCRTIRTLINSLEHHEISCISTKSLPRQSTLKIWRGSLTEKAIAGLR